MGLGAGIATGRGRLRAVFLLAVLAAILTWVTTTGSASLGFVYLLAFSFGMCTLLLVVGVGAGHAVRLPRAGAWMLFIKRGFAFLLLGVAEYYLISMGQLLT